MKKRKQILTSLLAMSLLVSSSVSAVPVFAAEETERSIPRAIITQDGEVDDMNSLIHMLLYANEIDIQGIVLTSSEWHWKGDPTPEKTAEMGMAVYLGIDSLKEPVRWPGEEWMYEFIDDYAEVYPNLIKHDPNYPTPEYLKSVTKVGNVGYIGETEEDTEGSDLIKNAILDEDDRPLYLNAWGGTNTIARALMTIEEENKDSEDWEALKQKITDKVIISAFAQQDQTYMEYIAESWPGIKFIDISSESGYGYGWKKVAFGETRESFSAKWMKENLNVGHGALLDDYVTWGNGVTIPGEGESGQFGTNTRMLGGTNNLSGTKVYQYEFISEGDSPAFFILMDSGLRNLEDSTYGGYGGRFKLDETKVNSEGVQLNYWIGQTDYDEQLERELPASQQWMLDIQNEFAARADWCIDADDANHEPTITITDDEGNDDIQELSVKAGDVVRLRAVTSDSDGDYVAVNWWQYKEAGTYQGEMELTDAETEVVYFTVPGDASGTQIHLIARGRDDGNHPLSHYARVILNVEE